MSAILRPSPLPRHADPVSPARHGTSRTTIRDPGPTCRAARCSRPGRLPRGRLSAHPGIKEGGEHTGETVHLILLQGALTLIVAMLECRHVVRVVA